MGLFTIKVLQDVEKSYTLVTRLLFLVWLPYKL
jgi:hypothetical protein